jgi:hypothetical protein
MPKTAPELAPQLQPEPEPESMDILDMVAELERVAEVDEQPKEEEE